jgi:hypothetical protein
VADNPIDELVTFNKGDYFHLSTAIATHLLFNKLHNFPIFLNVRYAQICAQNRAWELGDSVVVISLVKIGEIPVVLIDLCPRRL